MNTRAKVVIPAMGLLLIAMVLLLPVVSSAQTGMGKALQPQPPQAAKEKPADQPQNASDSSASTERTSLAPEPQPTRAAQPMPHLERTPGVPVRHETLIRIVAVGGDGNNPAVPSAHENGDVVVLKGTFSSGNYAIAFYRTENGTLREHRAYCGGTNEYDCAYYTWKNESTIVVRLCNTATQRESRYELSARDDGTRLKED